LKNKKSRFGKFPVIPKQFLFPIALALFIGISLGVIVLKMFTAVGNTEAVQVNGNDTPAVVTNDEEDVPASATPVSTQLPTFSVSIIQKGVFSTNAKAEEIIEEVNQLGYAAAAMQEKDLFYVFIGVASSKEAGTLLASKIENTGSEEPYVKTIEIAGGTFSSVDSDKVALVENTVKEFPKLLALTTEAFVTNTYNKEQWAEVKAMITSLDGISNSIESYTDEEKKLVTSIINAGKSFNEYVESGQVSHLWASEQHLLLALTTYNKLF
jgi:stage II sporulation protein B